MNDLGRSDPFGGLSKRQLNGQLRSGSGAAR